MCKGICYIRVEFFFLLIFYRLLSSLIRVLEIYFLFFVLNMSMFANIFYLGVIIFNLYLIFEIYFNFWFFKFENWWDVDFIIIFLFFVFFIKKVKKKDNSKYIIRIINDGMCWRFYWSVFFNLVVSYYFLCLILYFFFC